MRWITLSAALMACCLGSNTADAGLFSFARMNDCCAPSCAAPAACAPSCAAPAPAACAPSCAAPAPACAPAACAPSCAAPSACCNVVDSCCNGMKKLFS